MRNFVILAAALLVAGCAKGITAPVQHNDGGCPPGYMMSSGDKGCVPGRVIPAIDSGRVSRPSFDLVWCQPSNGFSGYWISAGETCP